MELWHTITRFAYGAFVSQDSRPGREESSPPLPTSMAEQLQSNMMYPAGTIVDNRYEILSCIGEGGMGIVFSAREIDLNRPIALKLLSSVTASAEDRKRFMLEAKIIGKLNHKNIIECYRFASATNDFPAYIAMELLQGQSLRELLDESRQIPWQRTVHIVSQIAEAMAHSHSCGIVHRDLKPNNVFLLQEPVSDFVKVLDFGLAKFSREATVNSQDLTQSGLLLGSINYMSPEQCQGKKVDARSDIYSLACILYELVSGQPPFVSDNPVAVLHKHVNVAPAALSKEIPSSLQKVIFHGLEKDPSHRYQTMHELLNDLELINQGEHVTYKLTMPVRQPRNKKKYQLLIQSSLTILTVSTLVAIITSDPITGHGTAFAARLIGAKEGADWGFGMSKYLIDHHRQGSASVVLDACADINPRRDLFSRMKVSILQARCAQQGLDHNNDSDKIGNTSLPDFIRLVRSQSNVTDEEVDLLAEILSIVSSKPSSLLRLSELSYVYLKKDRPDLAAMICEKLLVVAAREYGNSKLVSRLILEHLTMDLSNCYKLIGDADKAKKYFDLGMQLTKTPSIDTDYIYSVLMEVRSQEMAAGCDVRPISIEAQMLPGLTTSRRISLLTEICDAEKLLWDKQNKRGRAPKEARIHLNNIVKYASLGLSLLEADERESRWRDRCHLLLKLSNAWYQLDCIDKARAPLELCEKIIERHAAKNDPEIDSFRIQTYYARAFVEGKSDHIEEARKYSRLGRTYAHSIQTESQFDYFDYLLLVRLHKWKEAEEKLLSSQNRFQSTWTESEKQAFADERRRLIDEREKWYSKQDHNQAGKQVAGAEPTIHR